MSDLVYEDKKVEIISFIILLGFFVSIVFHYILAYYFQLGYPFSTFMFKPEDKFNDFFNSAAIARDLSPYNNDNAWFSSNYFPFANVIFWFFSFLGPFAFAAYALVFFSAYILVIEVFSRRIRPLKIKDKIILFFMSYPVLFALDRANIELYLVLFIAFFCYFYFVKKNSVLSIIFLAIAISMKLYPGVLLVLFLRDKKIKEFLLTIGLTALISIIPLFIFQGGFSNNISWLLKGLSDFNDRSIGGGAGVQHGSSLYAVIKIGVHGIYQAITHTPLIEEAADIYRVLNPIYAATCILIFLILAIVIIKNKINDHDSFLILAIVMILFPNVSYDYKLFQFIVPVMLFLGFEKRGRFSILIAVLYGLLMIPKDYVIIRDEVSISSILNPLIMTIMLLLTLLRSKRDKIQIQTEPTP